MTDLAIDLSAASLAAGRSFDGVGALSGGGATSVLLGSYAPTQRAQILDLLFKPGFGASLHMLKVEIGGDGDSTEGSESSHAHKRGVVDCHRGYEWQIMKEAKKRNPDITLYGLPWAFPSWLGEADPNVLKNIDDTAGYMADWVQCARDAHGLEIDVLGVWNEKDDEFAVAGVAYIKGLRRVLDKRGFSSVRIIAGDVHSWAPEDELLTDKALANATAVLCKHYPSTLSDAKAKQSGLPLWSSEDYAASNVGSGGRCEARILNQNWVNGLMSATINWNLLSAYYGYQTWSDDGFAMTARSPWSGHYTVQPPLWAAAHTTQFAAPGMTLLRNGSGSGLLDGGGSAVSYYLHSDAATPGEKGAPADPYLAVVIEKVLPQKSACGFSSTPSYAVHDETVTLRLQGGAAVATPLFEELYVWRSNLGGDGSELFTRDATPLRPDASGAFHVEVRVDDVVTVTSDGTRGHKGGFDDIPAAFDFPLAHADDFDSYADGANAAYFTTMSGAFDVANGTLKQAAVGFPVKWLRDDILPFAVVGDGTYENGVLQVMAMAAGNGQGAGGAISDSDDDWETRTATFYVGLGLSSVTTDASGFFFAVDAIGGQWFLAVAIHDIKPGAEKKWLAHGRCNAVVGAWHNLTLNASTVSGGGNITGMLNGTQLFSLRPPSTPSAAVRGAACVGSGGYYDVRFDNFRVEAQRSAPTPAPGPAPLPPPPPVKGCADIASGQPVIVAGCGVNATDAHQSWTVHPSGTIASKARPELCLVPAADGSGGVHGTKCSGTCLSLGACKGAPSFQANAQGKYAAAGNKCLDVDQGSTSKNRLELFECNNNFDAGENQMFDYDEATGILSPRLYGAEASCVVSCQKK